MQKRDKERVVGELVERLRSTDTLIVADYRGLSMSEMDGVRTELLQHGARFSVVKNTLTKRAAEEAGVTQLIELLEGPTAVAFVGDGDMVAVAKTLNETARRTRILTLKGGIVQGQAVTAEQVRELASLPPTEELQGQVLGAIVGPLNAIVGLFTAPLRELVGVVDARIRQLEEQEAAQAAKPEPEPEAAEPKSEPEAAEPEPEPEARPDAEEPAAEAEAAPDEPEEAQTETDQEDD